MLIYYPHKKSPPEQWGTWFNGVLLQPGTNYLSPTTMAELQANPAFASMVETGIIEILEATDDVASDPEPPIAQPPEQNLDQAPRNLSDMRAADAIALVKTSGDIRQLEVWAATEQRTTVLAAINSRIIELGGGE